MKLDLYQKQGKATLPKFTANDKLNDPSSYLPSQALLDAVNVSLFLGQPLLVTGEPGTGKTQLAYHIAHFFDLGEPLVFNAQTNSLATSLFYTYDALGHFQYNQNNAAALSNEELERKFIRYNALGEAIRKDKRMVVLIDEIDKAPRDLPNDILFAIESLSFKVPEIDRSFSANSENRPIIIITSNSEKNLPDAFMRRVVYHHVKFPTPEELILILNQKTEGIPITDLKRVIDFFYKIRNLKLRKPPSTAELIYWVLLLQRMNFDFAELSRISPHEVQIRLSRSFSVLAKNKDDLEILNNL